MLKKRLLKKPGLYLVTDRNVLKARDLLQILSRSMEAGLDMIQLRDKEATDEDLLGTARKIKALLKGRQVLFIINDRVDIARELDADGVHLGQEDMPIEAARRILGKEKIIGFSASSLKEVKDAAKKDVDYIAVGAIFPTPVKPDYKLAGLETLKKAVKETDIPLIAIGGIDGTNIEAVVSSGVNRVAVVRAILCADDPYLATKNLLKKCTTRRLSDVI